MANYLKVEKKPREKTVGFHQRNVTERQEDEVSASVGLILQYAMHFQQRKAEYYKQPKLASAFMDISIRRPYALSKHNNDVN